MASCPYGKNSADVSGRGCLGNTIPVEWVKGPVKIQTKEKWPRETEPSLNQEIEVKVIRPKKMLKFVMIKDSLTDKEHILDKISISYYIFNSFKEGCPSAQAGFQGVLRRKHQLKSM